MKTPGTFSSNQTRSFLNSRRNTGVCIILLSLAGFSVAGSVKTWDGSYSANWSAPLNWTGNVAPVNGDDLVFPAGAANLNNTNNNNVTQVRSITFTGSGYVLRSSLPVTITEGVSAQPAAGANTIDFPVTLGGAQAFECINAGATLTFVQGIANGGFTLTFNGSGALFAGVSGLGTIITGNGGVTKNGTGTLTYSGVNNTYTGTTLVNRGTLVLQCGAFDDAFRGDLVISDGVGPAAVRLALSQEMPNSTPVRINEGGTLDLNNRSETIGNLTIRGGTANSGTATLTLNGDLTVLASSLSANLNGNLHFAGGVRSVSVEGGGAFYALNLAANVSDDGGGLLVTNSIPASNFVRFLGSNSFTGPLTIANVTLSVEAPWALGGTNGATTVRDNSTLWLYSIGVTNEPLVLDGGARWVGQYDTTWAGPVTLNGSVIIDGYDAGNVLNVIGLISGPGGFVKTGSNTLRLGGPGDNTYTGDTTLGSGVLELAALNVIRQGTLTIGDGVGGVNADAVRYLADWGIHSDAAIFISNSGLLDLNGFYDDLGPVTMDGGDIATGGGTAKLLSSTLTAFKSDPLNSSSQISGKLDLNGTTRTFFVSNDTTLEISASVSSSVGNTALTKTGLGQVYLMSSNSYGGLTTVSAGRLHIQNGFALGSTNSGTVVASDASLSVENGISVGLESLTLNGDGIVGGGISGALASFSGSNYWAGPVTLASDSWVYIDTGDSLNLGGAVGGPGSLIFYGHAGSGPLVLSGTEANTYTGSTRVNKGALWLDKTVSDGAIAGSLVIGDGSGVGSGEVRLLRNNQVTDLADVLADSNGLLNLNGKFDFIDTLHGQGTVQFGSGGYMGVGVNNGSSTFDGLMAGEGFPGGWTLTKNGTGTFTLNGNNTYSNRTEVGEGRLIINGNQPQSPVRVYNAGMLAGTGTVGDIAAAGHISPGASPGMLTCSNLSFSYLTTAGHFSLDLTGPAAGIDYDQLNVRGTNNLANASLGVNLAFTKPVALGQQFTIIRNDGIDPITGIFAGYPEGSTWSQNGFTVSISYFGGTGNDVVLTLVEVPGATVETALTSGNGNHVLEPNECNRLAVVITNATGSPMTGISAVLGTSSPHVLITQPASFYPNAPANGRSTNSTPFQISTFPGLPCGSDIQFELTVSTASHGSFAVPLVLPTGSPALSPVRYDNNTVTNVPDIGTIESTNSVSGWTGGPLTKVAVSLWLVAPIDSDVNLTLVAPNGATVDLSSGNGDGANFGTGGADANRTTFDDAAAISITAGSSPFVGTFGPEGSLASLLGAPVEGDWRLRVQDNFGAGTPDTLRAWSLLLYGTSCSDGGGFCETCSGVRTGAIDSLDLATTNRMFRDGIASTCATPKACPGGTGVGPFRYDAYTFTNNGPDACVTVGLDSACAGGMVFATAYLEAFDPNNLCANYLADMGSSPTPTRSFSFSVPGGARFVIVVNETTSGSGCPEYHLVLSGLACPPPTLAADPLPNKVRLHWPTWAAGYQLEASTDLVPAAWNTVTNEPIVNAGRLNVTNTSSAPPTKFYRLHKTE